MIFPLQPNFNYCQICIFAILVQLIQIFSNFWWIFVPPSADPRVYKKWVCWARDLRTLKLRPPLDIPAVVVRLLWWLSQRRHPHVYGLVPTCQSCNKNTKISKYRNTKMKNTKYVSKDIHTNTCWYVAPVMQLTARQYLCHKYMDLIEIPFCHKYMDIFSLFSSYFCFTCTWLKYTLSQVRVRYAKTDSLWLPLWFAWYMMSNRQWDNVWW